jgi:3-hydroxyacyl-[acyl-carrier-protein] dehydratase
MPHGLPFVFIDRVLHVDEGREGVGLKNVTINEPYFRGHFPDNPVLPGVFIVEAMAQLAGLVAGSAGSGGGGALGAISDMRFLKPVRPGDQLVLRVNLDAKLGGAVRFTGEAQVGQESVARGTFTLVLDEKPD